MILLKFNHPRFVALFLAALLCEPIHAQEVQEYEFQPNQVYKIRTALGITTQIEISPREEIKDYSTGYSNGWDLARRDNVFYIKPKDEHVDTNMHIRTAAHNYIIELEVVSSKWKTLSQAKNQGVQYKVSFRYPSDTNFSPLERITAFSPFKIDVTSSFNITFIFLSSYQDCFFISILSIGISLSNISVSLVL